MNEKVIIILLNYNQNQYTIECINSLLKSQYDNYKIILIDNGSTQDSLRQLKEILPADKRIELHSVSPNRGYVGGINYGLSEGIKQSPFYFLIMNNDTVIEKNAISALVTACKNFKNRAIVGGKVLHFDEPDKIQDVGYKFIDRRKLICSRIGLNEIDNGQYEGESERDLLDDVMWLFPAVLYNTIGQYSTFFWFDYEQADFALRAKRAGYKMIFTGNAKIWHKGSVSIGGRENNPALAYYSMQGSMIYRYMHLDFFNFIVYYFKVLVGLCFSFLKNLRSKSQWNGKSKYLNAKFKGFMYFNHWIFFKKENNGYNPFLTK